MHPDLAQQVEAIADHLVVIRRLMRQAANADLAAIGLTEPQINVLRVLSMTNGLSIKQLSQQVGLAQSTVSGIVDRLKQRELICAQVDAADRRVTRIYTTEIVDRYLKHAVPSQRLNLVAQALEAAQLDEREQMLQGLALLRQYMEQEGSVKS
jgi:DNA-binding MarR family transcriptional regulator